jgi:hypothetical protein
VRRIEQSPRFGAWMHLCELLESAGREPSMASHAPPRETVQLLLEILGDAPGAQSADVAIQPLIDPLRCEQSRRAGRQRGQSRQSVAVEWQRRVSAEAQWLIRANKLSN